MLYSKMYLTTLKEIPQDAEVPSHQLMVRSGMIKKISAGVYTWLPLGLRVLDKIRTIIRDELHKKDCNELMLPILLPAKPWKQTGRWEEYGQEMFKLQDRSNREFCLGPTHEEIVTETVKNTVRSYRDLPQFVYQIQTKFRDEPRPRFGVIRCKEFIMKDLYSFHADEECLHKGYAAISEAYHAIFRRCGLTFFPVDADNGTIGGSFSHEYVSESSVGETEFVICDSCGYSATIEVAPSKAPETESSESLLGLEEVSTPNVKTIEEVSSFFHVSPDKILKTVLYKDENNQHYLVVVRGSDEVNETKLKRIVKKDLVLCTQSTLPTGYLGPIQPTSFPIIADTYAIQIKNGICGAMKEDKHLKNVSYDRDWTADTIGDIRSLCNGDPCPRCKKPIAVKHGMEIGHTFVLNDRYTKPLETVFTDPSGATKTVLMGCYGIGVTRLVAAIIEQYHDDKGIVWPASVTPFHVEIMVLNPTDTDHIQCARSIEQELEKQGYEVLIDDRDLSPGIKFKDAELIGIPHQIVLGRGLKEGVVEYQNRQDREKKNIPFDDIASYVNERLKEELHDICNRSNTGLQ
ncbi:MAG: proline--tRNA ligase [Caldisericia bacterium]|nr:proline--tRNA ligase [Caldisericia bacterium]